MQNLDWVHLQQGRSSFAHTWDAIVWYTFRGLASTIPLMPATERLHSEVFN